MNSIEQRPLGRTDLIIGVLGFGAMELRGAATNAGRAVSAKEASAVLGTVLDSGINFIDTSPDYGDSEETIGRAIGHRRAEYWLASKCGCPLNPAPDAPRPLKHDYSRANITAAVERSLHRLRTDHLDLLQLHISPARSVIEADDVIATLQELQAAGKARYIGSSSTLPNLLEHIEMGVFDSFQVPYSALSREHEEAMSQAAAAGAGIIVRGGVARGEPSVGTGSPSAWELWSRAGLDELLDGQSRTEFMLRFTISHPALSTTIVGTLNPAHVTANVAAASRGPLSSEVYQEAKRRLDEAAAQPAAAG